MTLEKQLQSFKDSPEVRTLLPGAIRAQLEAKPEATAKANTPICPDTSLPWSGACGQGGWSAKMYLQQTIATSLPCWSCSDTERVLSALTPRRLHYSSASAILLSDVIHPQGGGIEEFLCQFEDGAGPGTANTGTRQVIPALTTNRMRYDSRDCYVWEVGQGLRILDSAERTRFAGFPDGWFAGLSDAAIARLTGNAVVPDVAQVVGEAIIKAEKN